jgi:hypothetical protein
MGRRRKEREIDRLKKLSDKLRRKIDIEAKEKGISAYYPVSVKQIEDFARGICKYNEGTESYNRIKTAYEKSEAAGPGWDSFIKRVKEWEKATRENITQALLSADGNGWPMPVLWWIVYTSKTYDSKNGDSTGIPIKEAIRIFFEEFRAELDIIYPDASEESLGRALRRITTDGWRDYYMKLFALYKLNPSPYMNDLISCASYFKDKLHL